MKGLGKSGVYGVGRAIIWAGKPYESMMISDSGPVYNEIKNAGLASVVKCLGYGLSGTTMRYLALGSDSTANDPTQTALIAEISTNNLARAAATVSKETTTTADDTVRFIKQWSASGDSTVEEVGIFDTPTTGGVMLGRLLPGTQTLHNGNTFQFTYDVVFARA